ncbi:MAG: nucleotidyltransferase family protein [Hyphomicrobiaceae bacterium]|nr:MAG: nucleotidyltransferase family protein [Hyphomicrobiaceae bacterium]
MTAIACIILAAGRSTRMGVANKLLVDVGGEPMVRRVAEAALASRARPVLVVTGHQAAEVGRALAGLDVTLVANPDYAAGLSSSLRAGLGALPAGCDGALVMLGDMPEIGSAHIDRLLDAFAPGAIIVPVHEGRRGNPVLWAAAHFAEMDQLDGDAGARRLFARHADQVREIDVGTTAIFADIDTPEALAELKAREGSR